MSTQAWIAVGGLCAAPLFAALGWYLARRKVPKGCVTWRRVEGFAPEHGARGYETYVDVALPPGDIGREDLVIDIRAAGPTNEDVVAARRSPHPEETASSAASRAARIVARAPGSVRIELPDRPWTGARIAFHTAQPLGDVAVEARRGAACAHAFRMPCLHVNVAGMAVVVPFLLIELVRKVGDRVWPRTDTQMGTVSACLNGLFIGAVAYLLAYAGTLTWRANHPLLAAAVGRQPVSGPPTSPATPARPTGAEVDLRRPVGNAAAT